MNKNVAKNTKDLNPSLKMWMKSAIVRCKTSSEIAYVWNYIYKIISPVSFETIPSGSVALEQMYSMPELN